MHSLMPAMTLPPPPPTPPPPAHADVAAALAESARLGLGEPVALSAETGEGLLELYAALRPLVDAAQEELTQQAHHAQQHAQQKVQQGQQRQADAGGGDAAAAGALEEGKGAEAGGLEGLQDSGPIRMAIMGLPNVVRLAQQAQRGAEGLEGPGAAGSSEQGAERVGRAWPAAKLASA